MVEYVGIYGRGEVDEEGNLYLSLPHNLTLVRYRNEDGTYRVGIIDNMDDFFVEGHHLSLLEKISLKEWRQFFLEIRGEEEKLLEFLKNYTSFLHFMC
jgi:hypothetical protein